MVDACCLWEVGWRGHGSMVLRVEGRGEMENVMKSLERGWLMCVVCRR